MIDQSLAVQGLVVVTCLAHEIRGDIANGLDSSTVLGGLTDTPKFIFLKSPGVSFPFH
jgi:hypothetical protein